MTLGSSEHPLAQFGMDGLALHVQASRVGQLTTVTAVLRNTFPQATSRTDAEERSFFQVALEVEAGDNCRLHARPSRQALVDDESRASALIYRNAIEYSVGHNCSARTAVTEGARKISIAWIPTADVPAVDPDGGRPFKALSREGGDVLSALWLASADSAILVEKLTAFVDAYAAWLDGEELRVSTLPQDLWKQARSHVSNARTALTRMRRSVERLRRDEKTRQAFQLACRAMVLQRKWRGSQDLRWRPFQLGFQLLALESIALSSHPDRSVMDLLWFPTGGGKTEAYLGLTAFTLFHRRLRSPEPDIGAGVAVLMRYTLRLLTTQQFQRASALICACDYIRRNPNEHTHAGIDLGGEPFSIGLWVGGGATPNTYEEVKAQLQEGSTSALQLTECPACHTTLKGRLAEGPGPFFVSCANQQCPLGGPNIHLPVWTVDTDVYERKPSLVIGTVDKFAQLPRKRETGVLFGIGTSFPPPDLIIQDELHLISGPLGTMTALYEAAVDRLCTRADVRPKIVGSTATIRRAGEQVLALFARDVYQFPPQVIDAEDSCFAVVDSSTPGRRYVGVSSIGRSPKFALQAVAASLLQSAAAAPIAEAERDWYWTLIGYFNSLRELGSALVLMLDDAVQSVQGFAKRRNENPRPIGPPAELTSRRKSHEIPVILKEMELQYPDKTAYDVLLATNMISVGVDVSRLGLMIVAGQPKGISEYIQATSRVGRGFPGLVVTVFNHGRVRDRSRYETFGNWHATLYRDVEATSVTPFASRAQDRALHAVLVALCRHTIDSLAESPKLDKVSRVEVENVAAWIAARAGRVDKSEQAGVEQKLSSIIDEWERRSKELKQYWWDQKPNQSLLMSAEEHAALTGAEPDTPIRISAWSTPNSMRGVEPSTKYILKDKVRNKED
ncbi:MAG: helicase-related protein [Myxococcota bacterium]